MTELAGVAEIAEELGVGRNAVSMWDIRRTGVAHDFPQPVVRLASGPVYDMAEIRAWWTRRQHRDADGGTR